LVEREALLARFAALDARIGIIRLSLGAAFLIVAWLCFGPAGIVISPGPGTPADAGASLSENDRTEAMLDSASSQRDGVLAALDRIEAGRYGKCVDCGHDIPEGRLEVQPAACRCVGCQGKHARRRR